MEKEKVMKWFEEIKDRWLTNYGEPNPRTEKWLCVSCGQWTPHNHPEAHSHLQNCEEEKRANNVADILKERNSHYMEDIKILINVWKPKKRTV